MIGKAGGSTGPFLRKALAVKSLEMLIRLIGNFDPIIAENPVLRERDG
jgi:hypothetical protein